MKHVTIKDIARSLCISVSTVSRALTDDKNIRRETREAVLREAERLGYRRNPVAMNLKMGRTNTIGVIVPEMHTPYASQVVAGIQSVLYKNNQKVMIAESDENPNRERECLQMMEEFMVDGLIVSICSYKHNVETYRRLAKEGVAIVFYDRITAMNDYTAYIGGDNVEAGRKMAEYAAMLCRDSIKTGGRRPIVLEMSGPSDMSPAVQRHSGFSETMKQYPSIEYHHVPGQWSYDDCKRIMQRWLKDGKNVDIVFCHSDFVVFGAYEAAKEFHKEHDIRFLGIDGLPGEGIDAIQNGQLAAS